MNFDISGALGAGYSPKEIIQHLQDTPADADGFDIQGALKAGYTPAEIVDHLNPKAGINFQGVPVLAPMQRGVGHLRQEVANLADDVGFNGVASSLRGSTTQAPLAVETSGHKLVDDLQNGRILSALGNVPSAALEQAIPVAGGVGASMLSGGSLPITMGAGAGIGAITQGDAIARARAANNGRAEPSATDLALGLAGGAGVGAVGTVGLGGLGKGARAALASTARHAVADGAQPELAALAGSVGTDKGAQHASMSEGGAAALTGLATRGALGAPDLARGAVDAVRTRTPEGRSAAAEAAWNAMTPEDQQFARNQAAAVDAVRQVQRDAMSLDPVPDAVAASTAADVRARQVLQVAGNLEEQGVLPEGGKAVIRGAVQAAQDPKAVLTNNHLEGVRSLGLDAETTGKLTDALHQVSLLSSPEFTMTPKGPIEAAMRIAGPGVVGAALGTVGGVGPITGALAGHVLKPAGAGAFGSLGRAIDRMAGTADPSAIAKARVAAEMMQAAGVELPDTGGGLAVAMHQARSAIEAQARLMGLEASHSAAMDQMHAQARADNRVFDATSKAADKASGDQFALAYGDASKMNRDFDASKAAEHRQMYADALALDRQRTQNQNFQRSQEVGDARAIDAAQTRGLNLNEREGGRVAMMALRRSEASQGSPDAPAAPKDAKGPLADPEMVALNRVTVRRSSEVPDVAQVVPGMDGLSKAALLHGEVLPEWQYGVGEALKQALATAGMPKNINTAQEVHKAVGSLRDRGAFPTGFADALLDHKGRVVRGVYNLIRNEMLLTHGIDLRTLEAQQASQAAR